MKEEKLENIIKYFVNNAFYELMYDDNEIPNLSFDFKEEEARDVINKIILKNIEFKISEKNDIYNAINNVNYDNPVIEIHDYKLFFYALNKYIYTLYNTYMNNCHKDENKALFSFQLALKYIWLRMTPDDFKNPENFILKNIEMLENNTFNEYYNKNGILLDLNDDYTIYYKNRITSTFDEECKEMEFFVGSKYLERDYLPVVRYGIYKKDNKNICEIGSIQNKAQVDDEKLDIVNELRKELNKKVPGYLKLNVEPRKLLSLILFISLLQENNIDEISVPSLYVLDYDFHEIWEQNRKDVFNSKWSDYLIKLYPVEYMKELEAFEKKINKVEFVCQNKSSDYIRLYERLMYHISDIKVLEYPGDVSNYLRLSIPKYNVTDEVIKKLKKS